MLKRKMLRDLIENKGNYLTCAIIIIMGLMVFTALSTLSQTVHSAKNRFYENQIFADGFVQLGGIPPSAVNTLQSIEGIKDIQGRYVKDVLVWKPAIKTNVYLRLISVDPQIVNPINKPMLHQGKPLQDNSMSLWIDNKFFDAHELSLENQLEAIIGGRRQSLTVIGVASSPEFVYALQDASAIYPDPETFGVAFVTIDTMKKLFPEAATFNELVFTLNTNTNYELIEEQLKQRLGSYGLISIFPRADQSSHFLLNMELKALTSMSKAIPIMFLAIASMVLYITLKRLIEQQRGQIGILKAEGYTDREILFHYLSYALFIGVVGGTLGSLLGSALSFPLMSLYKTFFNLPYLTGSFSISNLLMGILLSVAFALFAGYQGCKRILRLEPAEAMRPPAPIQGKKVLLENIRFLWKRLSVQGMMAFRNLSRNKGRSLFIFSGIMLCFAISGFTLSMNDLIQKMLFDQYEKVEVYDVKITLATPLRQKPVQRELETFPGVWQVEPMAEIPATLNNQWHQKDVIILGLLANSQLYNILDDKYNRVELPKDGILLSERLAQLLDASIGTVLTIDSPFKNHTATAELKVAGIIPQYIGVNAYMELQTLQDLLKQPGVATSFMLKVAPSSIQPLQEKYMYSSKIISVDERTQRLGKLIDLMATYGNLIYIYVLVGIVLGFAIIYSASIISIAERQRELASMLVLGMTPREVLSVITIEQWAIGLPAMLVGIPASKTMMTSIARIMNNDLFSMPGSISFAALFLAFVITGISIWIAQRVGAKKINNMKLTEVLGARE